MSYAFGMFLKQLNKDEDAMKFIEQVKNTMNENILQYFYDKKDEYTFPNVDYDRLWIRSAFTMRFIYWPHEHLVGLSGYAYPDKVKHMFDAYSYFQNSTDQDYEFEEWSSAINIFDRNKMDFMSKNIETLYYQGYIDQNCYDLDDLKDSPDYYKKSCLYDKIYNDLKLDDWLWERPNSSFVSLKVNPIDEHNEIMMTTIIERQYKASIGKDTSMYDKMISSFLKRSQGESEEELEEMGK